MLLLYFGFLKRTQPYPISPQLLPGNFCSFHLTISLPFEGGAAYFYLRVPNNNEMCIIIHLFDLPKSAEWQGEPVSSWLNTQGLVSVTSGSFLLSLQELWTWLIDLLFPPASAVILSDFVIYTDEPSNSPPHTDHHLHPTLPTPFIGAQFGPFNHLERLLWKLEFWKDSLCP